MLGSALSLVNEPGEFQIVPREPGDVGLVVTGGGEYLARLARMTLFHM